MVVQIKTMARREELSNEQWAVIESLLSKMPRRDSSGVRKVNNGLLKHRPSALPLSLFL